jgi:hypothetical protein
MTSAIQHTIGEDTIILSESLSSRISARGAPDTPEAGRISLFLKDDQVECKLISLCASTETTVISTRISADALCKTISVALEDISMEIFDSQDRIFSSKSLGQNLVSKELSDDQGRGWVLTLKFSKNSD